MIIKIRRLSLIIPMLIIVLFTPGYFGLYKPYVEGSSHNAPPFVNIIIIILCVLTVAIIIKSFFYYLEINDAGITQNIIRRRTIKWQDIKAWGYVLFPEGEQYYYLFLEMKSDKNKREIIHQAFLDEKNFPLIKKELEKRLGEAILTTKQWKC